MLDPSLGSRWDRNSARILGWVEEWAGSEAVGAGKAHEGWVVSKEEKEESERQTCNYMGQSKS